MTLKSGLSENSHGASPVKNLLRITNILKVTYI